MLKKIWSYISFKQQPETEKGNNSYLKMMHGINRISILMFIVGIIIVLIKAFK
jgi:hypothetical protein